MPVLNRMQLIATPATKTYWVTDSIDPGAALHPDPGFNPPDWEDWRLVADLALAPQGLAPPALEMYTRTLSIGHTDFSSSSVVQLPLGGPIGDQTVVTQVNLWVNASYDGDDISIGLGESSDVAPTFFIPGTDSPLNIAGDPPTSYASERGYLLPSPAQLSVFLGCGPTAPTQGVAKIVVSLATI